MNLYDNALTQKWNATVAHDELRDSHTKINSIVMGTSKTFSFDITLPLIFAIVSVRDAECRYKRITDKIRSTR